VDVVWGSSNIDVDADFGKNKIIEQVKAGIKESKKPKQDLDFFYNYAKAIKAIDDDDSLTEEEQETKIDKLEQKITNILKDFFQQEPLVDYLKVDGKDYGWDRYSTRRTGKEGSAKNTANILYAEQQKLKDIKDGDVRERLIGVGALKFGGRDSQELNLPPFNFREFLTEQTTEIPIQEDMVLREIENKETNERTGTFSFKPEGDIKKDGKNYHFKLIYGDVKATKLEEAKANHIRETTGQNPRPTPEKGDLKVGSDSFKFSVRFSPDTIKRLGAVDERIRWTQYKRKSIPNPDYKVDKEGKVLTPNKPKTMVDYDIIDEGVVGTGANSPTVEMYVASTQSKAEYFKLEVNGKKGIYAFSAKRDTSKTLGSASVTFTEATDIPKFIEVNKSQIQEVFRPYLESATDILIPVIYGKISKRERSETTYAKFIERVKQDDVEVDGFTIQSLTDEGSLKNIKDTTKEELKDFGKKAFKLRDNLTTGEKKRVTYKNEGEDITIKFGDKRTKNRQNYTVPKNELLDNAQYEKLLEDYKDTKNTMPIEELKNNFTRTRKEADETISFEDYNKLSLEDKERYTFNLKIQTGAGVGNVTSSLQYVGEKSYAVGNISFDEIKENKSVEFIFALDYYVKNEGKFNMKPVGRESANRQMSARVNKIKADIRKLERKFGDLTGEVES